MPARDMLRPVLLSSNGDGNGTTNWNGDYSVTPGRAYYAPGAGEVRLCARLIIELEDAPNMRAEHYGTTGAPLANGITIAYQSQGEAEQLLTPEAIVKNGDWLALCYEARIAAWGAGNEILAASLCMLADGVPIYLDGDEGDYLEVNLNDDLSGLVEHRFLAKIYERGDTYSSTPDTPTTPSSGGGGTSSDAVAPYPTRPSLDGSLA